MSVVCDRACRARLLNFWRKVMLSHRSLEQALTPCCGVDRKLTRSWLPTHTDGAYQLYAWVGATSFVPSFLR